MGKSRQKEYRQAGHPRARGSGHTTGIDARTSAGKKTFSGPQRCCDDRDSPEKLVQGRGTLVSCENVQGLSQNESREQALPKIGGHTARSSYEKSVGFKRSGRRRRHVNPPVLDYTEMNSQMITTAGPLRWVSERAMPEGNHSFWSTEMGFQTGNARGKSQISLLLGH